MHEWKRGSQNESEIKVDYFAAASLFNFGMRFLVQSNKGVIKTKKRYRLNPASLLFKENYMPTLANDSFSSAGKASEGMPISLSSGWISPLNITSLEELYANQ